MKQRIRDTILTILKEKRANGDVLPYATSIEVAHRLHMGAWEVEQYELEGITRGRTVNYEYYYE